MPSRNETWSSGSVKLTYFTSGSNKADSRTTFEMLFAFASNVPVVIASTDDAISSYPRRSPAFAQTFWKNSQI
jgi:hypothetical protein